MAAAETAAELKEEGMLPSRCLCEKTRKGRVSCRWPVEESGAKLGLLCCCNMCVVAISVFASGLLLNKPEWSLLSFAVAACLCFSFCTSLCHQGRGTAKELGSGTGEDDAAELLSGGLGGRALLLLLRLLLLKC